MSSIQHFNQRLLAPATARRFWVAYVEGQTPEAMSSQVDSWIGLDDYFLEQMPHLSQIPEQRLLEIRSRVLSIQADCRRQNKPTAVFDSEIIRHAHEIFQLTDNQASSHAVWSYLTVRVLPDVAAWRWESSADEDWIWTYSWLNDRVLGSVATRHTFGRLWWQSKILGTESAGWRGEVRDQISERTRTLASRPVVATRLARELNEYPKLATVKQIRAVAAKLSVVFAAVPVDFMPDEEVEEVIVRHFHARARSV